MRFFAIFAFCLLLPRSQFFAQDSITIFNQKLALGGVAIGNTEQSVLTKLGKPIRKTNNGEGIQLDYKGLTIWIGWFEEAKPGVPRRVYELFSTSKQYCTPSGVCPGLTFEKVKTKLGEPLVADREEGRFVEYPSSESPCWLQISVKTGKIHSIRAECLP